MTKENMNSKKNTNVNLEMISVVALLLLLLLLLPPSHEYGVDRMTFASFFSFFLTYKTKIKKEL